MPRRVRDAKIDSATQRLRLAPDRLHWSAIRTGLALGYRRGMGAGTWYVRLLRGSGKYLVNSIGPADDNEPADGLVVLNRDQAHDKALAYAAADLTKRNPGRGSRAGYTVADACEEYLTDLKSRSRNWQDSEWKIKAHVLPEIAARQVAELTTDELEAWHRKIATTDSEDADVQRRRRATANRNLTILKAALNRAWERRRVPNRDAWSRVRKFQKVDSGRIRFLTAGECKRLINRAPADFRKLVEAALLTGCRYGELCSMKVGDFNREDGSVFVPAQKTDQARHVPLTDEGRDFFERHVLNRSAGELMFVRADGAPWEASHQKRRMSDVCEVAKIEPAVSFHILRHTYASMLVQKGVSLQVVARLLGHTSTRMTERHYAHLQPDYIGKQVRKKLPKFGVKIDRKVRGLRR